MLSYKQQCWPLLGSEECEKVRGVSFLKGMQSQHVAFLNGTHADKPQGADRRAMIDLCNGIQNRALQFLEY